MNIHRLKLLLIPCIILLGFGVYYLISLQNQLIRPKSNKPTIIDISGKQKVKYSEDYTIVMVGDSMTETLGNFTELKGFLTSYYKGKTFQILNYGFGATSILSVMDRITKETEHGRKFMPIADIDYDLILLESFGENPLSQYSLEEGLRYQNEELDKIVSKLKEINPRGKIVFVATISPNKIIFAQNQVDLSQEKRAEWVTERIAYMKNHIQYAKSKNIPVINIFEESLLENGDGNSDYISTDDYIHPSPTGIIFISQKIADYIYKNKILPY